MSPIDRFRLWRVRRALDKARRQVDRCATGRHHWKNVIDHVRCCEPGCGKRYGA